VTAEPIAEVVADLRAGRVRFPMDRSLARDALLVAKVSTETVVDATAIYRSLVAKEEPIWLYEDHPCIAPPWDSAAVCYVNEHGNVMVMTALASEFRNPADWEDDWKPAQPVEWDRVRWILNTFLWLGGHGGDGAFPTTGPVHMWRFAIYRDGEPADLRWIQLVPEYPMKHWDMAHATLLGSLNFLNCRNVELVEPQRHRGERRRLGRTGVVVKTINVFPAGRSSRTIATTGAGTPLTSVRGHFAHYGPQYDRRLLFGKLAGRFWHPQSARGKADLGEHLNDYRLRTGMGP
jgi:hypothetical protein